MSKRLYKALAFLCVVPWSTSISNASDINSISATRAAILGSAYRSERQDLPGTECITGDHQTGGVATSSFSFQNSLTQDEAAKELGIEAGGRAQFGAVQISASAKFAQSSVSSTYSVSSVWMSDYRLPVDMLVNPHLTAVGAAIRPSQGQWDETCGDEYVSQITRGAKLFFSIRVDFSSKEQKQSFEAKFSLSGPLYSAEANLTQASKEFSRDTKVTVSGFQVGGDVSKLTAIFQTEQGPPTDFVQCTLGSFDNCAKVIGSALTYASDTTHGFPSQIAPNVTPGGAPLSYATSNYSSAGILFPNYPYLKAVEEEARRQLQSKFEEQFRYLIDASRLLELSLGVDRRTAIELQKKHVDSNMALILDASKVCYDTPEKCPSTVAALTLTAVDRSAFDLPPLPIGSFRILTTHKGLWSRADSVQTMMATHETAYGPRRTDLWHLGDGEASVILYVQGVGIDRARLMFENSSIKDIPLSPAGGRTPEKVGDDYNMLVVETTRGNPDWRDIDTSQARDGLWKGPMPQADGVFYVLIHDVFGRETRFDIEYEKWSRTVTRPNPNTCTISESWSTQDRWWDANSGGISVAGTAAFTDTGSGSAASTDSHQPCN